jgi:hypothetical protein
MFRGQIAGQLDSADATPELLGYLMATGQLPEPGTVQTSA